MSNNEYIALINELKLNQGGEKLRKTSIGNPSSAKTVYLNDQYFITEKKHCDFPSNHTWGYRIDRQTVLGTDQVLRILKQNPHPNLANVINFNSDFVAFENVHGRLIDKMSIDLPNNASFSPNNRVWIDLYPLFVSRQRRKKWSEQVRVTIEHLHNIGVCHTDIALINIMIDMETDNIKIIDLLSCMPYTVKFSKIDWQCFEFEVKNKLVTNRYFINLIKSNLIFLLSRLLKHTKKMIKWLNSQIIQIKSTLDKHNEINIFHQLPYQPILNKKKKAAIISGDIDSIRSNFTNYHDDNPRSERICIDRLEMILNNVSNLSDLTVLDIGCSNGFFVNILAELGAKSCLGIDNSVHNQVLQFTNKNVIDLARESATINSKFVDTDFIEYLSDKNNEQFDIVIFFSVLHHLFGGYGDNPELFNQNNDVRHVLDLINEVCQKTLFFEMCERKIPEWDADTIPQNIMKLTSFHSYKALGISDGYYPRTVYMFEK